MIESPAPPRGVTGPRDQAARLREMVDHLMIEAIAVPARRAEAVIPAPGPTARAGPVVAITSGKGGVGKTFTAVNLSIALSHLGCRVSLVDADPGLANADVMCGLAPVRRLGPAPGRSLEHLEVPAPGGFGLVPGSVGVEGVDESGDGRARLGAALRGLAMQRDVVIVDTGAGLASAVTSCLEGADLVIVVVTPEPTSMADAYAMIKCLRASGRGRRGARVGVVVNQACGRVEASTVHSRLSAVCERFLRCSPTLLGVISRDERVRRSILARRPLLAHPGCQGPARRDLLALGLRVGAELGLKRTKLPEPQGLIARWSRRVSAGFAIREDESS